MARIKCTNYFKVTGAFLGCGWLRTERAFPKETGLAADRKASTRLQAESKGLASSAQESKSKGTGDY